MHCIACSNFNETCQIEEIYASGMLKKCPAYLSGDDVISKNGGNLQIRMETIYLNPGSLNPRISIHPLKFPKLLGWQAKYMICFDGRGIVRTYEAQSLPGGAVWFAWQDVKKFLLTLNNSMLLNFIPIIDRRITFDYSVVKYSPVPEIESGPAQKPVVKEIQKLVIPTFNSERMMDVKTPSNELKERGDQMDLFAL